MSFIIRGVRMFSGWPREEAAQGGLRRVHRLCGLTLGSEDQANALELDGEDCGELSKPLVHLRLVTVGGERIQLKHEPIDRSGIGQSVSSCARELPR